MALVILQAKPRPLIAANERARLFIVGVDLEAVLKCYEKNNIAESFRILSRFLVVFAEFHRFRCSHRSLFNSQKHLKNHS